MEMMRAEEINQIVDSQLEQFETFEEVFRSAKKDGFVFDMGGGIYAEFEDIWPYGLTTEFMFDPIENEAYWEERRKLGDDFTIHISNSERLLELAQQYSEWLRDGKPPQEITRMSLPPLGKVFFKRRIPFCEPGDAELINMMFRARVGIQSGWRNWSIWDVPELGTVITTSTQGRRVVDTPFEDVKKRLQEFEKELKQEGLEHSTAEFAARQEEWLDRTFPKVC